jgi:hypothetical protein
MSKKTEHFKACFGNPGSQQRNKCLQKSVVTCGWLPLPAMLTTKKAIGARKRERESESEREREREGGGEVEKKLQPSVE